MDSACGMQNPECGIPATLRSAFRISESASPFASAFTASVVTQVARFVSIGQLPSARAEAIRNSTPLRVTACCA